MRTPILKIELSLPPFVLDIQARFHAVTSGEGKRRKEFAEWYVEWRAE